MIAYSYDIEVFPNFFSISFMNMSNKEETHSFYIWYNPNESKHNDYIKLLEFLDKEDLQLIGYNNYNYDSLILAYIFTNSTTFRNIEDMLTKVYEFSNWIIWYQKNRENLSKEDILEYNKYKYYRHSFKQLDLMQILNHDKLKKSLKQTLINVNFHNILDYNKGFTETVCYAEIEEILYYNMNDAEGTRFLALFIKNEIISRYIASKKYGLNLYSISRPKLAHEILAHEYEKMTGIPRNIFDSQRTYHRVISINDCIDKRIKFQMPELKSFLAKLKATNIVSTSEIDYPITINGVTFNIKTGGLHSEDNPAIYEANDLTELIDGDVNSFYPRIITNLKVLPAHLKYAFLKIILTITDERLNYKALSKKKNLNIDDILDEVLKELSKTINAKLLFENLANILKIVINSIFGGFGSDYKFWSDRKAMVRTTINGQLLLLTLIEELTLNNFKVISANTDGFITIVPKKDKSLYETICNSWCARFNFELEYTNYKKYVRRDVNCYLAIKTNGEIKYKGDFNPENYKDYTRSGSFPGFDRPIISLALVKYYTEGIPIRKTITNYINTSYNNIEDAPIFLYCSSQKTDKKFQFELHSMKKGQLQIEHLQKDLRFYISKGGGRLLKVDKTNNNHITRVFKDYNITPFNKFVKKEDYDLDFAHYIIETQKIINIIEAGTTNKRLIKKNLDNYEIDFNNI